MALADWFPKRTGATGKSGKPRLTDLNVGTLQTCFGLAVPLLAGKAVETALVCARLADGYRDMDLQPITPEQFENETIDLDAEAWRRLALAVTALDLQDVRAILPSLLGEQTVREQIRQGYVGLAHDLPLLTMELMSQSELRVEEFARNFVARIGAQVMGETPQQSRERLHRLDYARLLEEAEQAKESAEERLEYIRKLQEEQDKKTRRGKW